MRLHGKSAFFEAPVIKVIRQTHTKNELKMSQREEQTERKKQSYLFPSVE